MSRLLVATICAAMLLVTAPARTHADAAACQAAIKAFNAAQDAVAAAVTPYSDCIADNNGREPCTRTFKLLQTAQQSFAAAVSQYNENCN